MGVNKNLCPTVLGSDGVLLPQIGNTKCSNADRKQTGHAAERERVDNVCHNNGNSHCDRDAISESVVQKDQAKARIVNSTRVDSAFHLFEAACFAIQTPGSGKLSAHRLPEFLL